MPGVWCADNAAGWAEAIIPIAPGWNDAGKKIRVAVLACRKSDNITPRRLVRTDLVGERVDHIQQQGDAQADHSALLSIGAVKQKSHLHGRTCGCFFSG